METVDVAYEILKYFSPAARCRYRLINRAFNEACILRWRKEFEIDFDEFSNRNKAMSFLRFLSAIGGSTARKITNMSVDDQLLQEMVQACDTAPWGPNLIAFFGNVATLNVHFPHRVRSYVNLADFLFLVRNRLSDLRISAPCPVVAEVWDRNETELCVAIVELVHLNVFYWRGLDLKGDMLTCLNPDIVELIIEECPDLEDKYAMSMNEHLTTMAPRWVNLELLRITNVDITLATFRQLCLMPRLRLLYVKLNLHIALDDQWAQCVCANDSIELATLVGRIRAYRQLVESCPWPMDIDVNGVMPLPSYPVGSVVLDRVFWIRLSNPRIGPRIDPIYWDALLENNRRFLEF